MNDEDLILILKCLSKIPDVFVFIDESIADWLRDNGYFDCGNLTQKATDLIKLITSKGHIK